MLTLYLSRSTIYNYLPVGLVSTRYVTAGLGLRGKLGADWSRPASLINMSAYMNTDIFDKYSTLRQLFYYNIGVTRFSVLANGSFEFII